MPIDPSIALSGVPLRIPDPMQVRGQMQAAQLNDLQLQNEQIKQQEFQRARAEDDALRQLFSGERIPSPGEIYRVVGPARGGPIVKALAELQKTRYESEQAVWEGVGRIANGILVLPEELQPQAYEIAKQKFVGLGVPADQIPPFSKDVLQSYVARATEPKDFASQQHQAATLQTTKDKNQLDHFMAATNAANAQHDRNADNIRADAAQKETGRHNRAMEQKQPASVIIQGATDDALAKVPPQYQMPLSRALMSLPQARRQAIVQLAGRAAGDEKQLQEIIRQAAIESEPVDTRRQIQGRMETLRSLADVRSIIKDLKNSGVDTNILRGTTEDVARKLGTSTDTRMVRMGTRLTQALVQYRRAMSGVQFSVPESEQYESMFPNYRNTFPLNEAILSALEEGLQSNERVFWETKLGPGGAQVVGALPKSEAPAAPGGRGGVPTYEDYLKARGGPQ